MLKSDILSLINKKYPALSNNDIDLITDLFFKKIVTSLKQNKKIELRGFGTFSKKINKVKYVRNPRTNEKIYKKENFKLHFKIGKTLHKLIN